MFWLRNKENNFQLLTLTGGVQEILEILVLANPKFFIEFLYKISGWFIVSKQTKTKYTTLV